MTFNLPLMKDEIIYRHSLYIGSFPVEEQDNVCKAQKVQRELESLRCYTRSKSVIVCVSIRGIKICSDDLKVVYMAHALRRISYATCDAAYKQVAFLAREPSSVVNLQYCHVFVTASAADAEELNRIIGDAFKLAYVRQRLIKLRQTGKHDSSAPLNIPQLSDCHPVWLPQVEESSISLSLLDTLKLPPPPHFPPPTSTENETSSERQSTSLFSDHPQAFFSNANTNATCTDTTNSSNMLSLVSIESPAVNTYIKDVGIIESMPTTVENPTTSSSSSENDSNQLSVHSDSVLIRDESANSSTNMQSNKDASELEKKLHRISTPQAIDLAFLRRHFLRRSEGKGSDNSRNVLGGSARQPRLRHGTTLSNLLSSARHSAFFPSSSNCVIDSANVIPKTSNSQETPDVSDVLNNLNPTRRPPIFVDLRTFAGGSPVVALKERLDAQAIADAKASAFAEAAAVLAAAKQVSSQSLAATRSNMNNVPKKLPQSTKPVVCPVVSHTSNSSFTGNTLSIETSDVSPPVPPVRMHSLRRSHEQYNSKNFTSNLSTPNPIPDGMYNELDKDEDREIVESIEAVMKAASYDSNSPKETRSTMHQDADSTSCHSNRVKRQQIDNSRISQSNAYKPAQKTSEKSCLHGDIVSQSQAQYPTENLPRHSQSGFQHSNSRLYPPNENFDNSLFSDPLRVTADNTVQSVQEKHQKSIFPSSGLSTETPTPTATPTPTPEQSSQSLGCYNNDDSSLNQAPWYQALLPREIAFELLAKEEVGSFIVRNSATHPGCCALSVRVPNKDNPIGITHYLIQKTNRGVRLKGLDKEWPSLQALVTHLTVIPEMLPCPLKLPQYTSNPVFTQFDPQLADSSSNEIIKQRRNYNIRSLRTDVGDNNRVNDTDLFSHHPQRSLHSVADLPCRPVPPLCATLSHLDTTNSDGQNFSSNNSTAQDVSTPGCYQVSKLSQSKSNVPNWLLTQLNDDKRQISTKSTTSSPNQKTVRMDYIHWKQNSVDLASISQSEYVDDRSLSEANHSGHKLSYTTNDLSKNSACLMLDYVEEDDDEDYQRLSDFSSILADLNLVNERPLTSC
ncbi:unnamed protein product [Heterobilharzia americana]|nr:unnamed protein product [Heterobilharzia americana]